MGKRATTRRIPGLTGEAEDRVPDVELPPALEIEGWAAPEFYRSLQQALNSPEVAAMEIAFEQLDGLSPEMLALLYEYLPEEETWTEDTQLLRAGLRKLRAREMPSPMELSNVAFATGALRDLARGLEDVEHLPAWAGGPVISEHVRKAERRLDWPGCWGVRDWLSDIAKRYDYENVFRVPSAEP